MANGKQKKANIKRQGAKGKYQKAKLQKANSK
jgi:hypothetical protein